MEFSRDFYKYYLFLVPEKLLVLLCLMLNNSVPNNIGFNSITRKHFITRHVSKFTNQIYNTSPDISKVIADIDCTHNKIGKSINFRILRKSYSVHKGEYLVKLKIIVAMNGYIRIMMLKYCVTRHKIISEI